jgi:UDP-glucose:(heptosyl)LPS alpha-1,3-glucosyltransferase
LTTASCGYAFRIELAKSGLVCAAPFQQEELDARLLEMLTSEQRKEWSANGREYGGRAELYSLPEAARKFIEQFAANKLGKSDAVS